MAQKKDRSRFTIKFRENDPAHDMTIRILENQGQRNITPFIVNAVLHYVQCSETPDMSYMLAERVQPILDKRMIEDIVWGILRQQGIFKDKNENKEVQIISRTEIVPDKEELNSMQSMPSQNVVSDDMRAMIAKTLTAFRRE